MNLDKKDRLILYNQYEILEKLYPDRASEFATCKEAVEYGYELHYDWMTEFLTEPMSRESCDEVLNIMSMFSTLMYVAKDSGADQDLIDQVKFHGFDGNNESDQLSYARFLILQLGRFSDLKEAGPRFPSFNSHMPTLHRYRAMLAEWKKLPNKWDLSLDEVARVANAGRVR